MCYSVLFVFFLSLLWRKVDSLEKISNLLLKLMGSSKSNAVHYLQPLYRKINYLIEIFNNNEKGRE